VKFTMYRPSLPTLSLRRLREAFVQPRTVSLTVITSQPPLVNLLSRGIGEWPDLNTSVLLLY
jgi:hypothetical protein